MKHLTRSLLSSALAFWMPAFMLHAEAPAGGDPFVKGAPAPATPAKGGVSNAKAVPNTAVVVQIPEPTGCLFVLDVYSLDKNDAAGLLDSERGSAARYRRVTDLAGAGKARLEILTALVTRSGQRSQCQSTDEVRYASEFIPPQTKNGTPTPTSPQTRSLGDTLEIEPYLHNDARTWDVNLSLSRVCLAGFRDIGGMAGDAAVTQPQFDSQKIDTPTSASDGEPHFLGSFTPPTSRGIANGGAASQVWLAFLHMTFVKPTATPSKQQVKAAAEWRPGVNLEYTCYSMEKSAARDVLVAPATWDGPWEKVQALIGEKKARFEHIIHLDTISGQRAAVAETQEMPFAANYNPEQWNGSTQDNRRKTTAEPAQEKGGTTTETADVNRTEPNSERIPGSPREFETRKLGVTVEVEPAVGPDGLSIDLNQVLQSETYVGDLKTPGAGAGYPAFPIFETRKITTNQSAPAGRRVLVGTLNPPVSDGVSSQAEADRAWLVFVRVTPNEP